MNNITEIKCFIASPGDTSEERDACEQVFEDINNGIGKIKGFRLSSLRWEKDVYPSVGEYGQEVINAQMNGEYDLFIGIMKSRFGTPTPNAGSGTEEEFDIAYEKYKKNEIGNIFFYFGKPNTPINEDDCLQLSKVMVFKKKMEENGVLYKSYMNLDSFKATLKHNLEDYFVKNGLQKKGRKKSTDEVNVTAKSYVYDYP